MTGNIDLYDTANITRFSPAPNVITCAENIDPSCKGLVIDPAFFAEYHHRHPRRYFLWPSFKFVYISFVV